eukprot:scaffold102081_cov36-Phaeocystis_antarctica.AAC.1
MRCNNREGGLKRPPHQAHRPARSSPNPDPPRVGPEPWLGGSAPWRYNPWNSGYTAACTQGEPAEGAGNRQDQPRHDQPHRAQPRRGRPRPSRPRVEAIPDDYPRATIQP